MGGKTRHEKYNFCSFDNRDMLILLKDLALEPCNMKSSHQRLQNRMLKVRKFFNASAKRPQRKRKFNQYESDSKLVATFGPITREKYGNQNAKTQRKDEFSSLSLSPLSIKKWGIQGIQKDVTFAPLNDRANCSHLCNGAERGGSLQGTRGNIALATLNDRVEKWSSLQGTQGNVDVYALNDRPKYCYDRREDYSHLSDYDESNQGTNPMIKWNLESHCQDIVTDSSSINIIETLIKEETNMQFLNVSKSSFNDVFDVSSEASHSLSSDKEDIELSKLHKNVLPSKVTYFPRFVIPIGPRFQAEVPKWEGTTNIRHHSCDDVKWLGTQIWPIPGITETNTKVVGKGRSDSCSCNIPGSIDCVQQHVHEARKLLQSEIGKTFSSWKFDRMGEYVSKSWTLEEQKEFESLVRLYLQSDDTNFWELAMDHFPAKSMKSMVRYYYNVYIPRRISMETRSSSIALDCDNDQNEDYNNEDGCSTT